MNRKASISNDPDRRTPRDRRHRSTNPFSLQAFAGRRKTIRREADRRRRPYADQYGRRLLLVALLLVLLCVADALYTLLHVSAGGIELNPMMDGLLRKGPYVFFGVKFILTALGIVLLVLYRYHPLAQFAIGAAVLVYGVLFCYQIFLHFTRSLGGT